MAHPKNVNKQEQHIIEQLEVHKTELPNNAYFEDLKSDLFEKIAKDAAPKIVPLYKRWYSWTAIAAGIALLLTVALWTPESPQKSHPEVNFRSLSQAEILDYLHENIDDVEVDHLTDQLHEIPSPFANLPADAINDVATIEEAPRDELFQDIDKDEIIDYLHDQDLDEELLLGS